MGLSFYSLYRLSENDKMQILGEITPPAPPEDVMTINKEVWQVITARLDTQEEMIKRILDEITKNNMKSDGLSSTNDKQSDRTERSDDKKSVNNGSKLVNKIDRSKFAPLVDGEKEVKEISDSWEDILASIDDGTYREKYKIGNYKSLDLGSEGIIRMQIAGFDAEELAHGSGRAAITWIAMDLLETKHRMNPMYEKEKIGTGGLGGWKESEMRKYLDTEIKPLIPSAVKNEIKSVKKYSVSSDVNNNEVWNEITEDQVWIPSAKEVFGYGRISYDENKAVYYSSLFSSDEDRKRTAWWWLRSAYNGYGFNGVRTDGSSDYHYATGTGGVALGFCT